MTARDPRYTIHPEYTGEPGPLYVARFCREWISSHDTAEQARRACDLHHQARMTPARTLTGARQMSRTATQETEQ